MHDLTHASFFSGVGGLDLGLERAGWRTVSFSEIDPYANAVLAERWPGVPNLGDILDLSRRRAGSGSGGDGSRPLASGVGDGRIEDDRPRSSDRDWHDATLWSGGFPCQDLSVAGKRAGFAGERSSLAFAFLDLVRRHRPPAILLENVPGLLSSHAGRDFGTLLGTLAELRYGWAYRILDAKWFGVPQRRRRVFIVALDLERGFTADRAAEVLSVGTRCDRHPATGHQAGAGAADGAGGGADIVGTVPAGLGHHGQSGYSSQAVNSGHVLAVSALKARDFKSVDDDGAHNGHLVQVVGDEQSVARAIHASTGRRSGPAGDEISNLVREEADPGGVRAPDGLAGRVDDRTVGPLLSGTSRAGQRTTDLNTPFVYTKSRRAQTNTDDETWVEGDVMPTINAFDVGDTRTTAAILSSSAGSEASVSARPRNATEDDLLPLGLDSHRYRCCGNGVVSSVAEWVGLGLAAVFA